MLRLLIRFDIQMHFITFLTKLLTLALLVTFYIYHVILFSMIFRRTNLLFIITGQGCPFDR